MISVRCYPFSLDRRSQSQHMVQQLWSARSARSIMLRSTSSHSLEHRIRFRAQLRTHGRNTFSNLRFFSWLAIPGEGRVSGPLVAVCRTLSMAPRKVVPEWKCQNHDIIHLVSQPQSKCVIACEVQTRRSTLCTIYKNIKMLHSDVVERSLSRLAASTLVAKTTKTVGVTGSSTMFVMNFVIKTMTFSRQHKTLA